MLFDVVDTDACHIIIGKPWVYMYDLNAIYNLEDNTYKFQHNEFLVCHRWTTVVFHHHHSQTTAAVCHHHHNQTTRCPPVCREFVIVIVFPDSISTLGGPSSTSPAPICTPIGLGNSYTSTFDPKTSQRGEQDDNGSDDGNREYDVDIYDENSFIMRYQDFEEERKDEFLVNSTTTTTMIQDETLNKIPKKLKSLDEVSQALIPDEPQSVLSQ
nr:hypothetical protein [Tanacetum cinerariifolium]